MTKYVLSASLLLSLTLSAQSWTVQPRFHATSSRRALSTLAMGGEPASAAPTTETEEEEQASQMEDLTQALISKLRFRELQSHLSDRDLPIDGTTGQLRDRLREAVGLETECIVNEDGMGDDCLDEPTAVSDYVRISGNLFFRFKHISFNVVCILTSTCSSHR